MELNTIENARGVPLEILQWPTPQRCIAVVYPCMEQRVIVLIRGDDLLEQVQGNLSIMFVS